MLFDFYIAPIFSLLDMEGKIKEDVYETPSIVIVNQSNAQDNTEGATDKPNK